MSETNEAPFDEGDIKDGKLLAILCYIPCCVNLFGIGAAFFNKDNDFHAYHARQGLGVLALWVVVSLVLTLATLVGMGAKVLGMLVYLLGMLLTLGVILYSGLGVYYATLPEYRPLPVLGPMFTKFFGFINKTRA